MLDALGHFYVSSEVLCVDQRREREGGGGRERERARGGLMGCGILSNGYEQYSMVVEANHHGHCHLWLIVRVLLGRYIGAGV